MLIECFNLLNYPLPADFKVLPVSYLDKNSFSSFLLFFAKKKKTVVENIFQLVKSYDIKKIVKDIKFKILLSIVIGNLLTNVKLSIAVVFLGISE